jgi:hypothetical protein
MTTLAFLIPWLNILSVISGVTATITGVTKKETWANDKPTKLGVFVLFLALVTLVSQVGVKLIEKDIQANLNDVYEKAYTGWVSVGGFDSKGQWKYQYLKNLPNPKEFKSQKLFLMTGNLNGREEPLWPLSCSGFDNWIKSEENIKTIFYGGQVVRILKVEKIPDCNSTNSGVVTRVLAKITDARSALTK